ncbi:MULTISPECIES: LysR substrate-binding domain-containing protein [unclassified Marinobacter]|uniref:LysR substrate-binding domain-containing protein n=1 Tax=unclassified Marinobacter TaxID=83889 RepID=UPI0019263586|nr:MULTISPECIES: LysR substrate-binding domain-containing protein [unclassified Marinobacter]MBL3827232.1 LysR family transcriptional regulator [Marinobacter sp. MC3]MBL3895678.1 LysR family transcriptional regulator [Marinobacter sp. MW3]
MTVTFDIDALRAIVAGTELRSFARAAAQLGRSQSAVSMQLKKLEQQAGTQLFVRRGRSLVPTDAGEALVAYARRIIALNDEAALALGATATTATVRLGLPQDFFEDVMPATLSQYSHMHPGVHVEVQAGPNHVLAEEVRAGRLDVAIAFYPENPAGSDGKLLGKLAMHWLAHESFMFDSRIDRVPLVLFDHPCLFRQSALAALEKADKRWRVAVTTPSLPGIWAALRSQLGLAVRTEHAMPEGIQCADETFDLPKLPAISLKLLRSSNASAAVQDLCDLLEYETIRLVAPN